MEKTVFVLLIGNKELGEADHYQLLQEETARTEGKRAHVDVEVVLAPAFDQLRVVRRRLGDTAKKPVDAVVAEPANVATMDFLLRDLKGKTGLVLLNSWTPSVEQNALGWGSGLPFGTISTNHLSVGEVQGRQISALVPSGGAALCRRDRGALPPPSNVSSACSRRCALTCGCSMPRPASGRKQPESTPSRAGTASSRLGAT